MILYVAMFVFLALAGLDIPLGDNATEAMRWVPRFYLSIVCIILCTISIIDAIKEKK